MTKRRKSLAEQRRAEIQRLDNAIVLLREALKPFAAIAGKLDGAPNLIGLLTETDFKRAEYAYNGGEAEAGK